MVKPPKKNEKEKKDKKDKKDKKEKKPVSLKDDPNIPNMKDGYDEFKFKGGDMYTGNYIAYKDGNIFRQGYGQYTTRDGECYSGQWDADGLVNDSEMLITYSDSTSYEGNLVNYEYNGNAKFTLKNVYNVQANFVNNKPEVSGEVILTDRNDHRWVGLANANDVHLFPVNQFYENIPEELGTEHFKYSERFSNVSENDVDV